MQSRKLLRFFLLFYSLGLFNSVLAQGLARTLKLHPQIPHAVSVLFPGTFDPFHLSHFHDLQLVLQQPQVQKARILPIASAYYHFKVGPQKVQIPDLLGYGDRLNYLKNIYHETKQVEVSPQLKSVGKDIFSSLLHVAHSYPQEKHALLIGSDVLRLWWKFPRFQNLLQHMPLLVSLDHKQQGQDTQQLMQKWQEFPQIHFFTAPWNGLRSNDLYPLFLQQNKQIHEFLPPGAYSFLTSSPYYWPSLVQSYDRRLQYFLREYVRYEILPLLKKMGTSFPHTLAIVQKNPLQIFMWWDQPQAPAEWTKLQENLQQAWKKCGPRGVAHQQIIDFSRNILPLLQAP